MPNLQFLSARNPLGIIALFISLIYGVCALLLVFSVASLSAVNQERIVVFVILFPLVVLTSFVYLVTRHHQKLYAPGDFRTDAGFFGRDSKPEELGAKLRQEVEVEEPAAVTNETPQYTLVLDAAARSFLAEGLVFQELQREFHAAVRREVMVGSTGKQLSTVDGILETKAGSVLVETKALRRRAQAKDAVRRGVQQLTSAIESLGENSNKLAGAILCVVVDDQVSKEFVSGFLPELNTGTIEVRIFELKDLLKRYQIIAE